MWKRFGDGRWSGAICCRRHFELAKWDSNGASPDKFVPISRFPDAVDAIDDDGVADGGEHHAKGNRQPECRRQGKIYIKAVFRYG